MPKLCKEGCGENAYYKYNEDYYCRKHKVEEAIDIRHCVHGVQKAYCKEGCGGSAYCDHGVRKAYCKDCGGSALCVHKKEKALCKEEGCGGSAFCVHGKIKATCKEEGCGGSAFCDHGKRKATCKDCGGSAYCDHGKLKVNCITCNPKRACGYCKYVYVDPRYRFHPYCFRCYCFLNPDAEIPRKFKIKEIHLRDALKARLGNVTMVFDKTVDGGCSRKRPDVLIDDGGFPVIIECDENKHSGYDSSCENKRVMELFSDLGSRPLRMIRFNPDAYKDDAGVKHSSCFKPTTTGLSVNKKEWEHRVNILVELIEKKMKTEPRKEVEMSYLFY